MVCDLVMPAHLGNDWSEVVEQKEQVCLKFLTGCALVAVSAMPAPSPPPYPGRSHDHRPCTYIKLVN